jgi:hypothetical protein
MCGRRAVRTQRVVSIIAISGDGLLIIRGILVRRLHRAGIARLQLRHIDRDRWSAQSAARNGQQRAALRRRTETRLRTPVGIDAIKPRGDRRGPLVEVRARRSGIIVTVDGQGQSLTLRALEKPGATARPVTQRTCRGVLCFVIIMGPRLTRRLPRASAQKWAPRLGNPMLRQKRRNAAASHRVVASH